MSQPMPVLDRLLARRHELDSTTAEVAEMAWGAVKVRADAAADMYWQTPKEVWLKDSDYPPLRLPFPRLWIEWDQPDHWLTDSGKRIKDSTNSEIGKHYAVLVRQTTAEEARAISANAEMTGRAARNWVAGEACEMYTIFCFTLREGIVGHFPFIGIVRVADDGTALGETLWLGPALKRSRETTDLLDSKFGSVALLAIGLMNCKNVQLSEHESKAPIGRKQRRRNGGIKYHTIDVPGRPSSSSSGGCGDSAAHALHRVRGHFKTFTADAPLMGQHVGTYWWGWQVRGSKANGTNVADYKVVPA